MVDSHLDDVRGAQRVACADALALYQSSVTAELSVCCNYRTLLYGVLPRARRALLQPFVPQNNRPGSWVPFATAEPCGPVRLSVGVAWGSRPTRDRTRPHLHRPRSRPHPVCDAARAGRGRGVYAFRRIHSLCSHFHISTPPPVCVCSLDATNERTQRAGGRLQDVRR